MKLHGKIVAKEVKDVGKGKDAEANEVVVVTAKLDAVGGVRGKLQFVFDDFEKASEHELGDVVQVNVDITQGKLALTRTASR